MPIVAIGYPSPSSSRCPRSPRPGNGPLVLYLHASRFAYGYLLLLGAVYLLTTMVGLLHRPVVRAHARWIALAYE